MERLLSETEAGKRRFEAARERRLDGITKKAMEFKNKVENNEGEKNKDETIMAEDAGTRATASAGSGPTEEQREDSVTAQNVRDKAKAIEESIKEHKGKDKKSKVRQDVNDIWIIFVRIVTVLVGVVEVALIFEAPLGKPETCFFKGNCSSP